MMPFILELFSIGTAAATLLFVVEEFGIWPKIINIFWRIWDHFFPPSSLNSDRMELERKKYLAGYYADDGGPALA